MAFHFGGKVVQDGLVLYLDAANRSSYPGSGTVWNDLTINNNSGSLINGPTFNSDNLGSIVFDGVDDYADMGVNSKGSNTSSYTFGGWFKTVPGGWNFTYTRGIDILSGPSQWSLSLLWNSDTKKITAQIVTVDFGATSYAASQVNTTDDNTWVYGVGVWQSGVGVSLYVNGVFETITPTTTTQLRNSDTVGWLLGVLRTPDMHTLSNISTFHVYNRALSSQEILQNYNALRGRYGL